MEFLKYYLNQNIFPYLVIILILFLVSLLVYGLRNCCRSRGAIIQISECNIENVGEGESSWNNLIIEHKQKKFASSDVETRSCCFNYGVFRKNKNQFVLTKEITFAKGNEDVNNSNKCSGWETIRHLKEKVISYLWLDRCFCLKTKPKYKVRVCDDLQALEESSLDLLICKLDSLVLTFKSSDASRSSATTLSSISVDNVMAQSEKCLPLLTIN